VFYSISNCQEGLKGISFGNFLLKQVVEELARETPTLKNFVTLSPVPQFAAWLEKVAKKDNRPVAGEARALLDAMRRADWPNGTDESENAAIEKAMMALAAHYFLLAKGFDGRPVDPVARFHIGNGARLERINFLADTSDKSLREACGLMVNYYYDPKDIERNHENYANEGSIASSRAVRGLLKLKPSKALAVAGQAPTAALPAPTPERAES
jgi:malonyl-CoA decarboxylase